MNCIYKTKSGFNFISDSDITSQNTSLCLDGDNEYPIFLSSIKEDNNEYKSNYQVKDFNGVEISCDIKKRKAIEVCEQSTKIVNKSAKNFSFSRLNSAVIENVCYSDKYIRERMTDGELKIYYSLNGWTREGQWQVATPENLGLSLTSGHNFERRVFRLDSVSSQSTSVFYPLIVIEDCENNRSYFFEVEGGQSWYIEIVAFDYDAKSFTVLTGGCDEKMGFYKTLAPNCEYTTTKTMFGAVSGNFNDAVNELIKYKRLDGLRFNIPPVVFNDYMNCNWAIESKERLIGLIDKASFVGAEIFCIDDGWQKKLGVWYPDDSKFNDYTLQQIFDYIKSKNMKVGIWFEFESLSMQMMERVGKEGFLLRHGEIIAKHRPLGNFRSKEFTDYLYERVDELVSMGIEYIKNDHNNNEFVGTDMYGETAPEGLENNNRAFISFIDSLKQKYPNIIIENCASGGTREDWGTLKHFELQSVSDQEDYLRFPAVLSGSLAFFPSEKAGIWCYPYPLTFNEREHNDLTEDKKKQLINGNETVFNVVNSFMGSMCVSGRIDKADDLNLNLLKEGVSLYKDYREFISTAFPYYIDGFCSINVKKPYSFALTSIDKNKMLLAVWNISDEKCDYEISFDKNYKCQRIYPSQCTDNFVFKDKELTVKFNSGRTAMLFWLEG